MFSSFYRFESKLDIRLRLVDKDFWTRWELGLFQAIWYLKIPYPSTIFVFFQEKFWYYFLPSILLMRATEMRVLINFQPFLKYFF